MTTWNPPLYESKHAFVWTSASDVLGMLDSSAGEQILDVGCGSGQLTAALAAAGIDFVGIDNDSAMIEAARRNAPHVRFEVGNARTFAFDAPFDAIFSTAVLYWISAADMDPVLRRVHDALAPGGRFVAEFGGAGNVARVVEALLAA